MASAVAATADWAKRSFDVVLSAVLLILLSPLLIVCGALVWLVDGRPLLFRQERVGRYGRPFLLIKFRTMRPGPGGTHAEEVTVAGDPRVTWLGRVLRRYKLDELPQLWHVLAGDMSLVGPRPEVPRYVAAYERAYRALWDLRPGMTDWASLVFRHEEELLRGHAAEPGFYERVVLPRKLALARLYRRRRSVWLDVRLVVATMCAAPGFDRLAVLLAGPELVRRARTGLERGGLRG